MEAISLKGVKTHNLKNIDAIFPHGKIIVLTGVSGSGKSSLAFDTLYAEGQRRYVESLSAYARQFLERMEKPEVDTVSGILPAIAIQAKNVINNARSTVGTQTEVNDYLRVLLARVGKTHCEKCGRVVECDRPEKVAADFLAQYPGKEVWVVFNIPVGGTSKKYLKEFFAELEKQGFVRLFLNGKIVDLTETLPAEIPESSLQVVVDRVDLDLEAKPRFVEALETAYRYGKGHAELILDKKNFKFSEMFHCAECSIEYKRPTPNTFSFNSPLAACPECQGFGRVVTIDRTLVIPNEGKTLEEGAIDPWTKPSSEWFLKQMFACCRKKKIPVDKPYRELSEKHKKMLWDGNEEESDFPGIHGFFAYLEKKTYKMHVRVFLSKYRNYVECSKCQGNRLKPEALLVRFQHKNISGLLAMTVKELHTFFHGIQLSAHEEELAGPVLLELRRRLTFLKEVGLGYLTLDRLSRTLSGGESQRINLATSLGSSLVDTLYVLDEPSIGLHERDNEMLIRILRELRDLGNTVVVVEHDRQMIETADKVMDIGPFAGEKGGEIVFQGSFKELLEADTLTGRYLSGREQMNFPPRKNGEIDSVIRIQGAAEHNLKNIDVEIPLGKFVVLTGVSGSGKSTLLYEILYSQYQRFRGRPVQNLGKVKAISGFEKIDEMVLVDQSPIGRTPRSNPITYIKAFDPIRKIFAASEQARRHGVKPGDFSFNVDGGRCEECEGSGQIKIEMHFLADVYVECEKCEGKRYKKHILDLRYKGKNIHDVLRMTFEEASLFFEGQEELIAKMEILKKVGLGYLRLGQSALTLSAGEAQRMKLALEMAEGRRERILYLFDEPTTGLHYYDIRALMEAFWGLLERGHSILVIEHNMEVIRCADHLIDLGPEGGTQGGEVVFAGSLKEMLAVKDGSSHTAVYLKKYLSKIKSKPVTGGVH